MAKARQTMDWRFAASTHRAVTAAGLWLVHDRTGRVVGHRRVHLGDCEKGSGPSRQAAPARGVECRWVALTARAG